MAIEPKPPADVAIDVPLVRALLREQHPDLEDLALRGIGEGWDNTLFRLGDGLAVRIPRRAASAALIEHEQRWLPALAPRLPLPVPVPQRIGRPGCGFPWSWSITAWFDGASALVAPEQDTATIAVALGRFLRALHQPAPADAPRNPWRGVPLADRTATLLENLRSVDAFVDRVSVLAVWERALAAPRWPGPPLWIHGDLHPGNLIVHRGCLSAVIDFGDLTAGDPATDLSVAWMQMPPPDRATFRASARGPFPIDDDTWTRARGWALALGMAYMARSRGEPAMGALGRATVEAALSDIA